MAYVQLPDGSLLLTMASASDGGQYTCLAQNSLGTAQISFLLDFEELGRLATGSESPHFMSTGDGKTVNYALVFQM